MKLRILHRTHYLYRGPVTLNSHRLMLRPRTSHSLDLLSTVLTIAPEANLTWARDVFGNAVATASFQAPSAELIIEGEYIVDLNNTPDPIFDVADYAATYPFNYTEDDLVDLGPLIMPQYRDPPGRVKQWAIGFIGGNPTNTIALLKDISNGIAGQIQYQAREQEGTQSPVETLDLRMGSCRDFAVLFAEAVRGLGFGARIVSGYLYNPHLDVTGAETGATTHAWAEVYVPGAGWITFDPTNRGVGDFNLIPVAVARHIAQIMPVTGSFTGPSGSCQGMTVDVSIHKIRDSLATSQAA